MGGSIGDAPFIDGTSEGSAGGDGDAGDLAGVTFVPLSRYGAGCPL